MKNKIIIALDFSKFSQAKQMIDILGNDISIYKVGLEAYLNYGLDIINYLKSKRKKIFLDLKLNDISNTTIKALESIVKKNVMITTIHASVGNECIKKIQSLNLNKTLVAYVIALTSFSQDDFNNAFLNDISIDEAFHIRVKSLNKLNINAVICSAHEAKSIKTINDKIITICPGVRLNADANDQKRIMTPSQAINNGADYIVIGREVTLSKNPKLSLKLILEDLNENCN